MAFSTVILWTDALVFLLVAVVSVLLNLLVDVFYAVIDPRVRLD